MSALLPIAADIIARDGFIGDDYFEGDDYRPGTPCRVCPRAAFAIAGGRHPLYVEAWPLRCVDTTPTEEEIAAYEEIVAAEAAFARYLREDQRFFYSGSDDAGLIESWAEQDEREQTQVVGAVRAAYEYAGRPA